MRCELATLHPRAGLLAEQANVTALNAPAIAAAACRLVGLHGMEWFCVHVNGRCLGLCEICLSLHWTVRGINNATDPSTYTQERKHILKCKAQQETMTNGVLDCEMLRFVSALSFGWPYDVASAVPPCLCWLN